MRKPKGICFKSKILLSFQLKSASTDDVSACYFKDNYCNFFEGFDAPLQAISIDRYNGDPNSADWVLESGHPTVNNGILTMPLINNGAGNVAGSAILSSTHFLNYGSFEVRMKVGGYLS